MFFLTYPLPIIHTIPCIKSRLKPVRSFCGKPAFLRIFRQWQPLDILLQYIRQIMGFVSSLLKFFYLFYCGLMLLATANFIKNHRFRFLIYKNKL